MLDSYSEENIGWSPSPHCVMSAFYSRLVDCQLDDTSFPPFAESFAGLAIVTLRCEPHGAENVGLGVPGDVVFSCIIIKIGFSFFPFFC